MSQQVIDFLNQDSPLTHQSDYMGIDHLDSFLHDTQAAGKDTLHPHLLMRRLLFSGNCVDTDKETALHLLNAVIEDNKIFCSPLLLAVEILLGQAASQQLTTTPLLSETISLMTDYQLTERLENSSNDEVRKIMQVLLWEPHRIVPCESGEPKSFCADVRKIYAKQPLIDGVPLQKSAHPRLNELEFLKKTYYFRITD